MDIQTQVLFSTDAGKSSHHAVIEIRHNRRPEPAFEQVNLVSKKQNCPLQNSSLSSAAEAGYMKLIAGDQDSGDQKQPVQPKLLSLPGNMKSKSKARTGESPAKLKNVMPNARRKVRHMPPSLYELRNDKAEASAVTLKHSLDDEREVLKIDETNMRSRSGKKKYFMLSQQVVPVDAVNEMLDPIAESPHSVKKSAKKTILALSPDVPDGIVELENQMKTAALQLSARYSSLDTESHESKRQFNRSKCKLGAR